MIIVSVEWEANHSWEVNPFFAASEEMEVLSSGRAPVDPWALGGSESLQKARSHKISPVEAIQDART
jgi:hypothetical protein